MLALFDGIHGNIESSSFRLNAGSVLLKGGKGYLLFNTGMTFFQYVD